MGTGTRAAVIAVALGASWLIAQPARADTPAEAAAAAANVADLYCADVVADAATQSATALAAVSNVLARVSRVYDQKPEPFLLYWRGLLNRCLGQAERTRVDLESFVAQVGDDPRYVAQVREAKRRLQRQKGPESAASPAAAPFVAGAGLLGGAGALAGLSGWQATELQAAQTEYSTGRRDWADNEALAVRGEAAADATNGLLVGSIVAGAAGAVVMVLGAATGSTSTVAALLVPTPDGGLAFQVGGRW